MVPTHASSNNCKWIYPITFGGGLVGGDRIDMNIHVKRGCCALLTGQESTKVIINVTLHFSSLTTRLALLPIHTVFFFFQRYYRIMKKYIAF